MKSRVLIIDNKMDQPLGSGDLRRYLTTVPVFARRGPDRDLPQNLSAFSHIVISGSRASCLSRDAWVDDVLSLVKRAAAARIPTLGVCFGHQMVARAFGGLEVLKRSATPEFGWAEINNTDVGNGDNPVLAKLPAKFFSFCSHYEEVQKLPKDFYGVASSDRCAIQAMRHKELPIFTVQFHPERNVAEGDETIRQQRGKVPREAILNATKGDKYFKAEVATSLFSSFLAVSE